MTSVATATNAVAAAPLAVVHPINSGHELDREHPEDNLVLVRVEAIREVADPDHPRWSRYPPFRHPGCAGAL